MKIRFLCPLVGGALFLAAPSHADVYWQHNASVSLGGKELLSAQMHNAWSGDNHKTTFKIDASKLREYGLGSPAGMPPRGEFSFIERLGDDKILAVFPQGGTYIEEPYSTLKGRLRFDLWKGLDDSLGTEPIPELTPEQRRRLGRELRASFGALTNSFVKTYFRALPTKRTINGMPSRGYRLTTRVNAEPSGKTPQWMTMSAEWWLADTLAEDSEILAFTQRANALKKAGGPLTQSMWANETYAVLWQATPQPLQDALATLIGEPGSASYGFQGTPVQIFVTVAPPPLQQAMVGEARAKIELVKRNTQSFNQTAFTSPSNLKRQEIEPFLKLTQNLINQSRRAFDEALKGKS